MECYPMVHSPRGRAIVITMTEDRDGWQADEDALHGLFTYLDVTAKYLHDLNEKDLISQLEAFASDKQNEKVDCLWVVVMGHGGTIQDETSADKNKEYLLTADDHAFLVRENIRDIFDNKKHRFLVDKPKICLFQMCRGASEVPGVHVSSAQPHPRTETDARKPRMIAPFCDYIIGCATQPGTVAYRNVEHGSWYIQEICKVFMEEAANRDVLHMMTKVNQNLEARAAGSDGNKVQLSEISTSGLKYPLYLFPGPHHSEPPAPTLHQGKKPVPQKEPDVELGNDDVEHYNFVIKQTMLTPELIEMINVESSVLLDELLDYNVITPEEKAHIQTKPEQEKQHSVSERKKKKVPTATLR